VSAVWFGNGFCSGCLEQCGQLNHRTHPTHRHVIAQWQSVGCRGGAGSTPLASAELYDPATGVWSPAGSLASARYSHTTTLLPNGKVLVAGGFGGSSNLASAELFDPATNTWSTAGSMAAARKNHTATLLPTGKVLIAAGRNSSFLASAELYDPASNGWGAAASLANVRANHTATLLPNGKVLIAAGECGVSCFRASAELYNPATNTWAGASGSLATARYAHTATLLPNGKVLVAGGSISSSSGTTSAEQYDPATQTWTSAGTGYSAKHTATLLANGNVLVAGDSVAGVYDPAVSSWSVAGAMANARVEHTATLLLDGKVLVAGGLNADGYPASAELYNPATSTWSVVGALTTSRYDHTATLLPSGKVLVAGGYNGSQLASAELYDPATSTWSVVGSLANARARHTATLLPNGKVLVTGGYSGGFLASAELYDPATSTWSVVGALSKARYAHTATLLPNGKVLIAGGYSESDLASADLYDPATSNWSTVDPLSNGSFSHTLLPNGKVLFVSEGGFAVLYEPAANSWSAGPSMPSFSGGVIANYYFATLLPNGKVLIQATTWQSPGIRGCFSVVFDPATNTWRTAQGASTCSTFTTNATLLPNGKVLVVGGWTPSGYLARAELFDAGLMSDATREQTLSGITTPLRLGVAPVVTGSGFWPKLEASGGGTNSSATNFPIVQIMRVDNGQTLWLPLDAHVPYTDTSFASTASALAGFPFGHVLVKAFVNGIPSAALLVPYSIQSQSINFANPGSKAFGTVPTLTATATSGLTPTFTSTTEGVCTITSGGLLTFVTTGTCTITASEAGNANYAAATPVSQSFAVSQGNQNIGALSFAPSVLVVGGTSIVSATASSGLVVAFGSSVTPTICSVSGNTVTALLAGTCTITATQGGDANYAAAAPVNQSITVNPPAAPAMSFNPCVLNFVDQHVGSTSTAKTIVLSNTGGSTLTIGSVLASVSVFAVTNSCNGSLAAGGSCNLYVTFTPTAAGTRVGSVTLTSNAPGGQQSVSVSGVGVATGAPICTLRAAPESVRQNGTVILTASCRPAVTSYTWADGICLVSTAPTCTVKPKASTTFSVTGTNSIGFSTASTTVTVKPGDLTPILMLLLD